MLLELAAFQVVTTPKIPFSFTPDQVRLIVDTGASLTITNTKTDFIGEVRPVQPTTISVFASSLLVEGIGTVKFSFKNNSGISQELILKDTLYVPLCSARLLCPGHVAAVTEHEGDGFFSGSSHGTLIVNGSPTTVPYD